MNYSEQLTGIISFMLFTVLVFIFAIALAIRYRKGRRENEILKAKYAVEIQKVQLEMQEQTLKHISRELHDNIGHIASLAKINLNTISADSVPFEEFRKIENSKNLIRQMIYNIKRLSVELNSDHILRKGLLPAIERLVARLRETGLYCVELDHSESFPNIKDDKALVLYRMIQEIVNNVIKHSHASVLKIRLTCSPKTNILSISDNGIGFDTSAMTKSTGSGLFNLYDRAKLIGAQLDIHSDSSRGTTITIFLNNSLN